MAFLDVQFPRDIAAGSTGGPGRRTDVVSVGSGYEERNSRWADSRRTYQVGLGLRSAADLAAVLALFEEARGRLHSFRFRDWSDYRSAPPGAPIGAADQWLGDGDGARTEFQLRLRYGAVNAYWRDVTKPAPGTVQVSLDGVPQGGGWSVDHVTGLVTFAAAPAAGVSVAAGFEFDVPVRFDADRLDVDLGFFQDGGAGSGSLPDIALVEVAE
ncbi:DUF2460 domain-containing protein [Oceanicella actignis]|uniref:TIGR02217 family protein n=1 Tax=Oceanicella actignis TaxID=1189325 RepID=A0A1M7U1I3_9RHOB|nr:DUF2460 domain-containing protein [Oceanicella actignis]SES76814.1 TIGR02217 family protein [Oceanicella actignis]SHN76891.1 TIGR02217 family protein [Oceanicella actignis]